MRLSDVLELAAREGVRRRVEKRAGMLLPLAVGAMIPGIVNKAIERKRQTEQTLNQTPVPPYKMAALPPWLALPMAQAVSPSGPLGRAGKAIGGQAARAGREMLGHGHGDDSGGGLKGSFQQLGAAPVTGVAQGISGGIGESIKRMMIGRDFGEKKDPLHMGGSAAVTAFGKEMGTTGANLLRDFANKALEAAGHAGDQSAREAIIGDLKRNDPVLAGADDATLMEAYHTMSRFAPVLSTDKNAVRSFLRQAVTSGSGPDFMSIKLVADAERAVTGDKNASLADLFPALERGALMGAGTGAAAGALTAGHGHRLHGAMHGGLMGGLLGGAGGALHGHLTGAPSAPPTTPPAANQGGLNIGKPSGLGGWPATTEMDWGEGSRRFPAGVDLTALDLRDLNVEGLGHVADASARTREQETLHRAQDPTFRSAGGTP